jgi:hypothetical protein
MHEEHGWSDRARVWRRRCRATQVSRDTLGKASRKHPHPPCLRLYRAERQPPGLAGGPENGAGEGESEPPSHPAGTCTARQTCAGWRGLSTCARGVCLTRQGSDLVPVLSCYAASHDTLGTKRPGKHPRPPPSLLPFTKPIASQSSESTAATHRPRSSNVVSAYTGEVAERLNAPVSKTGMGGFVHRGFESLPLR